MDAVPNFHCVVQPSRLILRCSVLIHSLALLFVFSSAIAWFYQCLLVLFVVWRAQRSYRHLSEEVLSLQVGDREWFARYLRSGEVAQLDQRCYVIWPCFIILYRLSSWPMLSGGSIVLAKDSIGSDNFRRLTVRLRFNPC